MKKFFLNFTAILSAVLAVASCSKDNNGDNGGNGGNGGNGDAKDAKVTIVKGEIDNSSIAFTLIPEDASELAYICILQDEEKPTPESIFEKGTVVPGTSVYLGKIQSLTSGTKYTLYAAAKNGQGKVFAATNEVEFKTSGETPGQEMELVISDVTSTSNSVSFTLSNKNVSRCRFTIMDEEQGLFDGLAIPILSYGNYTEVNGTMEHEIYQYTTLMQNTLVNPQNLEPGKTYYIVAASEAVDSYLKKVVRYEFQTKAE